MDLGNEWVTTSRASVGASMPGSWVEAVGVDVRRSPISDPGLVLLLVRAEPLLGAPDELLFVTAKIGEIGRRPRPPVPSAIVAAQVEGRSLSGRDNPLPSLQVRRQTLFAARSERPRSRCMAVRASVPARAGPFCQPPSAGVDRTSLAAQGPRTALRHRRTTNRSRHLRGRGHLRAGEASEQTRRQTSAPRREYSSTAEVIVRLLGCRSFA
jgi:hypothetical protein